MNAQQIDGDKSWKSPRRFPRVRFTTPVEVRYGSSRWMGETENIGLGGALVTVPTGPLPQDRIDLRFNLPGGHTVSCSGSVVHGEGSTRLGVQFAQLHPEDRSQLEGFTRKLIEHTRQGTRKPLRVSLTLRRSTDKPGEDEIAETVVVSRNGGLLVTRAHCSLGEEINLYWPERRRGIRAKVIFRQNCGSGSLVELGFVFLDEEDFWGMKFQPTHPTV